MPLLLLLLFCFTRSVEAEERTLLTTAPSPGADRVLIARIHGASATLERWQVTPRRRLASLRAPCTPIRMVVVARTLVIAAEHDVFVGPADLSRPLQKRWHVPQTILQVTPFGAGWLVLAADPASDGHPKQGQVYWFTRPAATKPRRLSLRPVYNFWDVQAGDVEGDGRSEIALCTWSKTRYIRTYARRYFVYGVSRGDVFPRWRGSRLSKPYLMARLVRMGPGKDWKLLSVEQTSADTVCLMLYQWDDFGFYGLGRSRNLRTAEIVPNAADLPLAAIQESTGLRLVRIVLSRDQLNLEPVTTLAKGDQTVVGRFRGKNAMALIVSHGSLNRARLFPLSLSTRR